jgi:hypothetical protein
MALGVVFPDVINVGDNLVVVANSAGTALITTDISQTSAQQDLTASQNVNLGAVSGPGFFGVQISTDTDSFNSLITITPSGASLAVSHDDVSGILANPVDFIPAPAGGDAFDHFNQNLTVDILKRAVSKAVQDHPAEIAVAAGTTGIICLIAGAAGQFEIVAEELADATGAALGIVLEECLDIMVGDGVLSPSDAANLKKLLNFTTLIAGLTKIQKGAPAIETIDNLFGAGDSAVDLTNPDDNTELTSKVSVGFFHKVAIIIKIGAHQ